MERLLIICPHLSTGGQPEYTRKFIQTYKGEMDIHVCEYHFLSDTYVVQRNQIKDMVPLHSLYGEGSKLPQLIKKLNPDIVHLQELPEHFIDPATLNELFKGDRAYFIVATTHSSKTNPHTIRYVPDRWVLVNQWSKNKFAERFEEDSCLVWEYPVIDKFPTPEEKQSARGQLEHFSFHEPGEHYLNVGLFTPGKNQGALFEIARQDPFNHYHFVGNQAENFKPYWEPLMKNKPHNCYVWGERDDVHLFYQACDAFYFTSLEELNPICLKEALSYGLPVKMKKLPSYLDQYDRHPLVTYI